MQIWLEDHDRQPVDMIMVELMHGLSCKTFEHRFKKATGIHLWSICRELKWNRLKRSMEEKNTTFDEINWQTGYENSHRFREVYKKHASLLPTEYQISFRHA